MIEPTYQATFRGKGRRAQLTCLDDRCLLEIWVDGLGPDETVCCELLVQPADELGLPAGPPVRLAKLSLSTRETHVAGRSSAFAVLPTAIDARLARRCYLRISHPSPPDDD